MAIKDKVAALCHEQWSKSMMCILGSCTFNKDGSATIPADLTKRWQRQMNTIYSLLNKTDQAKYIIESDKLIASMTELQSKKTIADPRVKDVINKWIEYCQNIKGFKPEISWGADGAMVKKRLGRFTPEQLSDLFDFYLNSDDCKRMGCSLKIALGNFILNKYLINNNNE